jgi:4-amino-4-deoxy-L-arabinose transferase-like glycosyltransferase
VVIAVTLALLAGAALRFIAPSALWLDEAQSVVIARSAPRGLFAALRQDGSPPLYYLLLHGWTSVFGTGAAAVRALSGLFSVLALPVAWVLGRRLGGPRVAIALTLLLASSPFAIRYASETRMYSLIVLLVLLGGAAVDWAVRRPGPWPVAAVAVSGAALLLTHYWAAYLLAALGLVALAGLRWHRAAACRVLTGLALSGLLFLPWLPTLRWQLAHTGTPWAGAGGLAAITAALAGWQGGGRVTGVLLGYAFVVLAVLALIAVPAGDVVRLGASRSPVRWGLLALSLGTLVIAGLVSLLTASAVAGRYTSVALPPFLALVALGVAGLPGRRTRAAVLALCVLGGLGLSAVRVDVLRTQAAEVATALRSASPGDTVAFCPDQLGPSVSRLAPRGLDLVGYPDLTPADRVDWTDYAERNAAADPAVVAARLSARAGDHAVYLVTGRGYRVPKDADCARLRESLAQLRGEPQQVVARDPTAVESMRLHRFPSLRNPAGP